MARTPARGIAASSPLASYNTAMSFLAFILKNLWRRPARSMLTIAGLAVAVGAVVALVGVATGFERSFIEMYRQRDVDIVVQRKGGGEERLNSGLPEQLGPLLAQVDGVKQVVGGLVDFINFPDHSLYNVLINGWPADCPWFDQLKFIEGRRLEKGDQGKVILGRVLANKLGAKVGDTLDIYSKKCEVVGIYESTIVYENGGMFVLLKELQSPEMMNRPNEITGFTIQAKKPIDEQGLQALRKRLEAVQEGMLEATPATDFVRNVSQIRVGRAVAWLISAIALFIGAIGVLNTMVMSVYERTREIGTLRAIGWKKSRIVRMVMSESLVLSIAGGLIGTAAGIGLAKALSSLRNVSGISEGNVAPAVIAQGFAVAVLVGLLGAVYPALWSANLLPTEALRRK